MGSSGSYAGGMGSFSGSTGGIMRSYSGGMGTYGERGRFSGRGPKGWQRSDDRIREDINERLTEDPEIDAGEIEVTVKGAEVTLTGTVDDRHAKRRAEDIAEGVSGVREVHNQIRVQQGQFAGQESGGTQHKTGTGTSQQKK
jgi:osmotically-inducible protein OsmY